MKKCSKCKLEKAIAEFNKNKGKADGYNSFCRVCHGEHNRAYYALNSEKQKKQIAAAQARRVKDNYQRMWALLNQLSCTDCSTRDARVLEFDHLPEHEKRMNISELLTGGYGWSSVEEEIKKCEVVCANCHRIRTIERAGTYRSLAFTG